MDNAINSALILPCSNGKSTNSENEVSPEWIEVGVVAKLCIYPIMGGHHVEIAKGFCSTAGLIFENIRNGSFVIFKKVDHEYYSTNEICYADTLLQSKEKISIQYSVRDSAFILSTNSKKSLKLELSPKDLEKLNLQPVLIHPKDVIFVKDCGKDAGKWVSEVLGQENNFSLGYYDNYRKETEFIMNQSKNNTLVEEVEEHHAYLNQYIILNESLLNKINKEVGGEPIQDYDFGSNITIKVGESYQKLFFETSWKHMKINNIIFDWDKSCGECAKLKENYLNRFPKEQINTFQNELKIEYKDSEFAKDFYLAKPPVTTDMKVKNLEGTIQQGDKVYVKF